MHFYVSASEAKWARKLDFASTKLWYGRSQNLYPDTHSKAGTSCACETMIISSVTWRIRFGFSYKHIQFFYTNSVLWKLQFLNYSTDLFVLCLWRPLQKAVRFFSRRFSKHVNTSRPLYKSKSTLSQIKTVLTDGKYGSRIRNCFQCATQLTRYDVS